MVSTIQVRVDDDLKAKSDELFNQALAVNGFPFEIKKRTENPYRALSEAAMFEKLEKAREHAEQGMYKSAHDVSGDLRAKYGL